MTTKTINKSTTIERCVFIGLGIESAKWVCAKYTTGIIGCRNVWDIECSKDQLLMLILSTGAQIQRNEPYTEH